MGKLSVIKVLVLANCGSRREMTAAIKAGRVAINDTTIDRFTQPIDTTIDSLTLDGKRIEAPAHEFLYILLNKPIGILCATKDVRGRRTIMNLLPPHIRHPSLHPIGRLDMDSCGLIIITNDGDLTYHLTHPRFEQEKEYAVTLDRPLSRIDQEHIERGLILSDGPTSPIAIQPNHTQPTICYVTLREGRKRQLRRMFATMGYRVIELMRIREGQLLLGNLSPGHSRLLTAREIAGLLAPNKPAHTWDK
ncbi:MAG: rRNA pseudouridine synthase [Dehalococcoidia bacterium]|nr:rRNA pseudouridine synthase [Dehalococcoidia bacterium]